MVHWFLPVCPSVAHMKAYYSKLLEMLWWNFGICWILSIFCDETLGICWILSIFCVIPFLKTLDNLKVVSLFPPLTSISIVNWINCIYYLEIKCGGIWKFLDKGRVNSLFYFDCLFYYFQTLVNWMGENNNKMETLFISWVVAE